MNPDRASWLRADAAFVVIRGQGLTWAIPAGLVTRIVRGDDAALPEPLPIADELLHRSGTMDPLLALVVQLGGRERAIPLSGRLELVSAEGLSVQPLPPLCQPGRLGGLSIDAIAVSEDAVQFLVVIPVP